MGVFVSQSGETKDVLNAVEAAQQRGMGVLGLVNVLGSTLMNAGGHSTADLARLPNLLEDTLAAV